jgi:hypothetical protein
VDSQELSLIAVSVRDRDQSGDRREFVLFLREAACGQVRIVPRQNDQSYAFQIREPFLLRCAVIGRQTFSISLWLLRQVESSINSNARNLVQNWDRLRTGVFVA